MHNVLFLAPDYGPHDPSEEAAETRPASNSRSSAAPPGTERKKALKMTRSASEAVARMGIDTTTIETVLADPDEVSPDRDRPDRSRFVRGRYTVVTAQDGTVLAIYRR